MKRNKRSLGLWLVILGFALQALNGWERLSTARASWYWLEQAGADPGPAYLIVSGAVWGVVALLAVLWLLLLGRAYRWVGLGAAVALLIMFWVDRLFFSQGGGLGANLWFAVVASLVSVGLAALLLHPWQE